MPSPATDILSALLGADDPALYDVQTHARGPQGALPLTDEMLRTWSSGDLFGLTQAAGMGWTPAELLGQLARPLEALAQGARDVPDRHRTLRNAIAWSYTRLSPDEQRVFRHLGLLAGGGTAIMCKTGGVIHEFLPANELFRCAEAVLRVFHRLGDYKHKQRNRMKFLIKTLGWDVWVQKYEAELAACRAADGVPLLTIDPSVETQPAWEKIEAPTPSLISARVSAVTPLGPGKYQVLRTEYAVLSTAYPGFKLRPIQQFNTHSAAASRALRGTSPYAHAPLRIPHSAFRTPNFPTIPTRSRTIARCVSPAKSRRE